MPHVFLSHHSPDKPQVIRLARTLERHGVEVWFDEWELRAGDTWEPKLAKALEEATAVLACIGGHGKGPWHDREVDRARTQKSRLELVLLPGWKEESGRLGLGAFHSWSLNEEASYDSEIEALAISLRKRPRKLKPHHRDVPKGPFDGRPYPGLAAFSREHAEWFFGRERKTAEVLDRLKQPGWVWLVGNSGSGKSSLARAAVMRAFARKHNGAGVVLRPSENLGTAIVQLLTAMDVPVPLAVQQQVEATPRLALQLLRKKLQGTAVRPRLIVVDQFEEVFAAVGVVPAMEAFVEVLTAIALNKGLGVSVLAVLRADYLSRALSLESLRDVQDVGLQLALSGVDERDLQAAIREPAVRAGGGVEQAVIDELVKAVRSDSDGLPLLQVLLEQLWDMAVSRPHRDGKIRYEHLRELLDTAPDDIVDAEGLLRAGLARRIAMLALDKRQRQAAFELLVQVAPDRQPTRRRAHLADVSEVARTALDKLTAARLVVQGGSADGDQGWAELTHEAVIRAWPQCQAWAKRNAEALFWRNELEEAAKTWAERDKEASYLWSGSRYQRAVELLAKQPLSAAGRAFLRASKRRVRRARWLRRGAGVAALLLGLGFAAFVSYTAREQAKKAAEAKTHFERAEKQTKLVRAGVVVNTAQIHRDPLVSSLLLLAVEPTSRPAGAVIAAHNVAMKRYPNHVLFGHDKSVLSAAFSRDGRQLVTASADGTARVWSTDGRGEPLVLAGHHRGKRVVSAAFDATGMRVVTASVDRTARVWSADGRGEVVILKGHEDQLISAVFSSNGAQVLTTSLDGTTRVWQADGKGEVVVLHSHLQGGKVVADFSPDGRRVVTASTGGVVRVWRVDGAGDAVVVAEVGRAVRDVSFAPDGARVVVAGANGLVQVWGVEGDAAPLLLEGHQGAVVSAAFSVDGKRIITASEDGTARIWPANGRDEATIFDANAGPLFGATLSTDGTRVLTLSADGARVWPLRPHSKPQFFGHPNLASAAFSPDGRQLVTTSADRSALLWTTEDGEPRMLRGHEKSLTSISAGPNSLYAVTGSKDDTARVWRLDGDGSAVVLEGHTKNVTSVAFSPDGQRVVTGSTDDTARVGSTTGDAEPMVLRGHTKRINEVAFSPDGTLVATASKDRSARVWWLDGSRKTFVLTGHDKNVQSVAFSPDGTRLVTASSDRTARIWRWDGGGEPIVLTGHNRKVVSAVFSPDGRYVVSASRDDTARVWRANGEGEPLVLRGHLRGLVSAQFDNGGRRVVTASDDGTVRIWSLNGWLDGSLEKGGGVKVVVLKGNEHSLVGAAFSADGRRVVAASQDGTARVWSADGVGEPLVLTGQAGPLVGAVFTPDGKVVVTASRGGVARVWRVDWQRLLNHLRSHTSACLTVAARMRYLGESHVDATSACGTCQRTYGRSRTRCDETQIDAL